MSTCNAPFPEKEFLIVKHSMLNRRDYNIAQIMDEVTKLGKYTVGRDTIPALEGDLTQVMETGEVVFTHQSFFPLSSERYRKLREEGIAVSLDEALDKYCTFVQSAPERKVVLCLEPKRGTTSLTIEQTMTQLRVRNITDVYFDSFFGRKLDDVAYGNIVFHTSFPCSLHLCGNLGNVKLMAEEPRRGSDFVTVPYPVSFGELNGPVIYGAVGSVETLEKLSEKENVLGAYCRIKEGSGLSGMLKMLWTSVTNIKKTRG